ncbi:M48 family metalloprotease [Mesorhizobium huakuii]|uniref:M48 family metalloprotease n=1 Tax=Mesorhizobium huakuii TaxID=28104 RepID=A0A7G6T049_9HYPH|nr:M48 family metalloprotease [Mesorhizobium huakuii]QND60131.1 M48 family metalloprotease [Mesorhizobium huakuii]
MTLATSIFGTETRLRPLLKAVLVVTVLRVAWIALNIYEINTVSLAWALVPWPRWTYSWTAWTAELALIFYQLRAYIRLGRLLLLRFAPHVAAFLGFSDRSADPGVHLKPRNRSWWPTALLLCGILILTCQVVTWLALMLWYRGWAPFDWYLRTEYAHYPMLVGMALSVLGLMFGGRYIARASGDVSTSFGVVPVTDDHWLAVRVHGFSDRLNLPRPAVGITNVMNAFAMGARQKSSMVVIGKPLFEFEKDELDAIIGHELGHILHKDIARMQFAEGFQRMLVGVVNILTVFGMFMAASASKKRANARLNAHLAWGTGVVVRKTVFVASELVAKGISRNREFHADAVGAHVTSTEAMAGALRRIHGMTAKPTAQEHHYGYLMFRGAAFGNLFSTHPTLQARLKALDARASEPAKTAHLEQLAGAVVNEPVTGSRSLGFSDPFAGNAPPSPLWSKLGALTSRVLRATRRAGARLGAKVNMRRVGLAGAACVVLLLVAPAIVNFYGLDRRFNDATTSAGHALSSSWAWVADTTGALMGHAEDKARLTQLEQREQALKTAEAQLGADRQALVTDREALANEVARKQAASPVVTDPFADSLQAQIGPLNRKVAALTSERDDLRNTILDLKHQLAQQTGQTPANTNNLLLQLDAANADRARLTTQLAQQQNPAPQPGQVASLTNQLAEITAARDEMKLENDSLERVIDDLKTQIAARDTARVDVEKQLADLKSRIDNVSEGQPTNQGQSNLPGIAEATPQGAFGALAVARNGVVILTEGGYATVEGASDAAMAECRRFSNGTRCNVAQVFRDTCAAVARVKPVSKASRYQLEFGDTLEDASQAALEACSGNFGRACQTTRQVCVH